MTNQQRFHPRRDGDKVIAPSTIGAPQYYHAANTKVFEKTPEEKVKLKVIKANHKKELIKWYGKDANKKLNIPLRSLPKKVVNTF